MSIHLLSLIYFTNDRVCYMQRDFAFPPWGDQRDVAIKFRKWFNHNANKRWSDNKNRSLRRTYVRLGPIAADHPPEHIGAEIWGPLIEHYNMTSQTDEDGTVKKIKFLYYYVFL